MADAALFEFLHTEMVAELWAQDPDPGPGAVLVLLTPPVWASLPHLLSSLQVTQIEHTRRSALPQPRRPHSWARGQTPGTEDEPVGPGGHGLPCGPGPGREAAPGDASLQGGAGRPQVPMQRRVGGRVPKADGQPPHQSPGDLRPAGQQLPASHPDGLGSAVPGGSAQASGGVTCVDSARLCHLLPDVGKYPHLRAVHRGCDRPKWEEEGVSSVGGAPLQAPHPAPPQRTQLSTRSLACLRAFAHAIPCLAHSPNSCSLSGVQQPPASAAHHIPRSSCSLAWRLQPWGGAPRQPCPALPPCLLVYVPPRFPLGPSGSLSWVLALSSTEPADVSQMNRSHSAKVCACGRGGGSGGSAQPCPQEAQGCPGGSPPRLTTPPLRHTSLASLMGQGCWEGGRVLNWQRTGRRKLLESLVRGGRSSPGEGRGIAGLQGAVSGHRALLCGCLPHLPGEPLFHPSRQQQPQGDGTLESRGRPPRPTLCLRYLLPSHPHPQPRSHLSKNSARRLHLPSTNHCLQSLALPP
ncbi:trafficking protein particle complex subunit 6A isoform X3 [Physeter macrocephalus]|uniref:Trafficking protein particle complex subunit 6A isoform X3 n=1 Tax=Physeter macrocephalus TaxID=9755 RepID=A0A9W2W834_PHYMC|nr:trafficking protein particle complex subunit 6A isoform X3 [Physeter catodon]